MDCLTNAQKKAEILEIELTPLIGKYYFYKGDLLRIKEWSNVYIYCDKFERSDYYKCNYPIDDYNDYHDYFIFNNQYKDEYFKFNNNIIDKKFKIKYSEFKNKILKYGEKDINGLEVIFNEYDFNNYIKTLSHPYFITEFTIKNNYNNSYFKNHKDYIEAKNHIISILKTLDNIDIILSEDKKDKLKFRLFSKGFYLPFNGYDLRIIFNEDDKDDKKYLLSFLNFYMMYIYKLLEYDEIGDKQIDYFENLIYKEIPKEIKKIIDGLYFYTGDNEITI